LRWWESDALRSTPSLEQLSQESQKWVRDGHSGFFSKMPPVVKCFSRRHSRPPGISANIGKRWAIMAGKGRSAFVLDPTSGVTHYYLSWPRLENATSRNLSFSVLASSKHIYHRARFALAMRARAFFSQERRLIIAAFTAQSQYDQRRQSKSRPKSSEIAP